MMVWFLSKADGLSFSEKIDEEKARKVGIRQYIEKPFNRSDLAKLIRMVLVLALRKKNQSEGFDYRL